MNSRNNEFEVANEFEENLHPWAVFFIIYIYNLKKGSCPVSLPSTPQSPIQFQLASWASHVGLYHDDFNHLFASQVSSPSQYKLTKARDRWLLPLSPLAPAPRLCPSDRWLLPLSLHETPALQPCPPRNMHGLCNGLIP